MDFESIKQNFLRFFSQLMQMRVIVSSPREKAADLPALYVLAAVLISPTTCAAVVVLGLLFRYGVRLENDAVRM